MAQVKNNIIIQDVSGAIGKQIVLKCVNGKTILSKMPSMPTTRTPKQKAQSKRFKNASSYAKKSLLNPLLKELYTTEAKRRGIINAYNMALSDYMKAPEIKFVDTSAYTGSQIKEPITIEVNDNFKVVEVRVTISHSDKIIEEGNAIFTKDLWQYFTTTLNKTLTGTKITITAIDRPQNASIEEILL